MIGNMKKFTNGTLHGVATIFLKTRVMDHSNVSSISLKSYKINLYFLADHRHVARVRPLLSSVMTDFGRPTGYPPAQETTSMYCADRRK
jgi:hypothetical protein